MRETNLKRTELLYDLKTTKQITHHNSWHFRGFVTPQSKSSVLTCNQIQIRKYINRALRLIRHDTKTTSLDFCINCANRIMLKIFEYIFIYTVIFNNVCSLITHKDTRLLAYLIWQNCNEKNKQTIGNVKNMCSFKRCSKCISSIFCLPCACQVKTWINRAFVWIYPALKIAFSFCYISRFACKWPLQLRSRLKGDGQDLLWHFVK